MALTLQPGNWTGWAQRPKYPIEGRARVAAKIADGKTTQIIKEELDG